MHSGQVTWAVFGTLQSFWPGMQGKKFSQKILKKFHKIIKLHQNIF